MVEMFPLLAACRWMLAAAIMVDITVSLYCWGGGLLPFVLPFR